MIGTVEISRNTRSAKSRDRVMIRPITRRKEAGRSILATALVIGVAAREGVFGMMGEKRGRVQRPQSSSASRLTASQVGFFDLSQSGERPLRYCESLRFDTMPSRPILQAWANTVGPSASM